MTAKEFREKTDGIRADLLGRLLLCSRPTINKYRGGYTIPAKIERRVEELAKLLEQFQKTNL